MTAAATYTGMVPPQTDREQLTHLLRGLAARLDQLDRQLTDLAWQGRGLQIGALLGQMVCDRTYLESERARLSERLTVLAGQLNCPVAEVPGRVGTCPSCGYPSLASGLCAFCHPHLAR